MSLAVSFAAEQVSVGDGQVNVPVQNIIDAIRTAEASEQGIVYDQIASASGKEELGGGVAVGMTVQLLGNWQMKFAEGPYIAKIYGGNLVGGPGGDPIAYSAQVQVLLVQSAASTIVQVSTGSGLSTEEHDQLMGLPSALVLADAVWTHADGQTVLDQTALAEKLARNKMITDPSTGLMTIYDDDGVTPLYTAQLFEDAAGAQPYRGQGAERRERLL